ncbi:MAG: hypothetical protein KH230_20430 [Enterocloster asparagiformis]|nr:hypothetical protein [Enterocloster asparagiformis]
MRMTITPNNLNDVLYENYDTELLIRDVVSKNPEIRIELFRGSEMKFSRALAIWRKANVGIENYYSARYYRGA